MTLIPHVAGVMQLIFGQLATELAKTGQFIKRTRKLTGEKFSQILIFSWLSNANVTYCDMAQTTITLPDELSFLWSGCGGSCEKNTQSSMKVQASVDLKDGGLQVSIHDGKASDNRTPIQ